ncbi:Bypass of stop codon protein 6 [Yarrowia sp. B02]|nr:Bypass of stop codon protein 6 [Yarrowia sp. B02]
MSAVELERIERRDSRSPAVRHDTKEQLAKKTQVEVVFTDSDRPTSFEITSEVETNRETETEQETPTQKLMSVRNPPKNIYRLLAACLFGFQLGFSDGAPGALLPHIESWYRIGYAVVSIIWLGNSLGFITVAVGSYWISQKVGRYLMLTLSPVFILAMTVIISPAPPFPLVCIAYYIGGLGVAAGLAQQNIFVSSLDKGHTYLGFLHGAYGAGATVAPLIATAMISANIQWSFFFLILVGLSVCSTACIGTSWLGYKEDMAGFDGEEETTPHVPVEGEESLVRLSLKNKITWLLALFTMAYQGTEVAIGGWVVTYLIDYRGGDPDKVGYVAAGFWAGLTLGRFLLVAPCQRWGPKRSVIVLTLALIALIVLTWRISSIIGAAICVSFAGFVMGPSYPLLITVATVLVPRKIQVISITVMTAFGSTGGALFPFFVGITAQSRGSFVVYPFCLALCGLMMATWLPLPRTSQRGTHGQ